VAKKHTGSCACGAVTYGFDEDPTFIANCHCTDCKRASGGEMGTFAMVSEADFTVLSGRPRSFAYGPDTETCAGQGLERVFCADCGSRLFTNKLKDYPGSVFVQEGTLDRLDGWFAPQVEIYTWSREPFMRALDLPQFDHAPT
jgi:hypothetical protein